MGRVEDIYIESTFLTANGSPRKAFTRSGHKKNIANGNHYLKKYA